MGAPKFIAGWSEAQVTSWDLQLAPVVVSLAERAPLTCGIRCRLQVDSVRI